jgi:hypothetical protein
MTFDDPLFEHYIHRAPLDGACVCFDRERETERERQRERQRERDREREREYVSDREE